MTPLRALGGTGDLLPNEAARWQRVEARARGLLHQYGYREIRTPIIENAEVFRQSLGEATEIVQKQMYLFKDRGDRQVALRPEGTAPAVRAYLEHGFDKTHHLVKWYYLGPMFRAERPQAGRRRQFHQLGVEAFGSDSPYQDAEVIALLMHLMRALGVVSATLKVNNLGCHRDRPKMLEALRGYFSRCREDLCPDCQERLAVNPLRILDCKQGRCQQLAADSVTPDAWVCPGCRAHMAQVLNALRALHIAYEEDPRLVRGLDYYSKTAFEVIHPGLGAQDAVGGGGRYDGLVQQMGGPAIPAVGFALGLERLLMAQEAERVAPDAPEAPSVFVASLGAAAQAKGLELLQALRQAGIAAVGEYESRPVKRQLELANRLGCPLVLLLGDEELAKEVVTIRDMHARQQVQVTWEGCVDDVRRRLRSPGDRDAR